MRPGASYIVACTTHASFTGTGSSLNRRVRKKDDIIGRVFMNRQVLDPGNLYRYNQETDTYFIDIHINFYREMYNEWDFSPLKNRDLDDDLFEYLETCAGEIPKKHGMAIVFHVPLEIKDPEKETKSSTGFKHYLRYQIRKLNQKLKSTARKLITYGILGFGLISMGYLFKRITPEGNFLIILIEGLFIGGWVLFWELFSIVFFTLNDFRKRRKILERLESAELMYEYMAG
jgi:hypothetical protein